MFISTVVTEVLVLRVFCRPNQNASPSSGEWISLGFEREGSTQIVILKMDQRFSCQQIHYNINNIQLYTPKVCALNDNGSTNDNGGTNRN
ncbi:hypothetical protein DPMN_023093 [Dreissena polymorpha]|uniref:Uncharacterized protein n=1 Tax=Dreissena polymorpha TaxID=45954 RepID=A0A9D4LP01_DREPO|nr:hypothetical protein DPMN_023093 [Dreissena polymorpha]